MPYVIAEPCVDVKDKSCVEACPVDCIYEIDDQLVINPEEVLIVEHVDPCLLMQSHMRTNTR